MRPPRHSLPWLVPALGICLAASPTESPAAKLQRDYCTGLSPVSWQFSLTVDTAAREVSLKPASPGVTLLAARPGPSLPDGWSVTLASGQAVARGETPLPAGREVAGFLALDTDRAAASVGPKGAQPVKWELHVDGGPTAATFSFPPVLDLADAVSRGLVTVSAKARSAVGPVEMTVDNPTLSPLWLDLPPGSVLQADGHDWIVGLAPPYDMLARQKTGRTVPAFPVLPAEPAAGTPHRVVLTGRRHEQADLLLEVGLAVRTVKGTPGAPSSRQAGTFESLEPFDFWPLVTQWSFWQQTAAPPRLVLLQLVQNLLQERTAAGDSAAASIDPVGAAQEVESALIAVDAARQTLHSAAAPVAQQASQARFPRG